MITTFARHLTFDQQAEADPDGSSARPCACWLAGHGDITGLTAAQVQHPQEWADGARAAFEQAHDL